MHRRACALAAAAALAALPARAELRVHRLLDWRTGLPSSFTSQVEQDPQGFLWVVTSGGVVRYDGQEARLLTKQALVAGSVELGRPVFLRRHGEGALLQDLEGRPLPGPGGPPLLLASACVTRDGTLWARAQGAMWRRDGKGWRGPLRLPRGTPIVRGPFRFGPDTVVAASEEDAFVLSAAGAVEPLAPARGLVAAVRRADGRAFLGCWRRDGGHVLEVTPGGVREIEATASRLISLALRGEVLWVAYDYKLVRIPPGGRPEEIGHGQDLPGGGMLYVDRENALWVATARGLLQFPEPDTVSWFDRFPFLARNLARTPEGVWMSSWGGVLSVRPARGGWSVEPVPVSSINPVCPAPDGTVWSVGGQGFLRHGAGGLPPIVVPGGPNYAHGCSPREGRRVWFPTDRGLFVLMPGGPAPRPVPPPPTPEPLLDAVAEDAAGEELWVAAPAGRICRAPLPRLLAGAEGPWSCEEVPGLLDVLALRPMPSGDLWAGSGTSGVWRRRSGRWEPIPASRALASLTVRALVPSRRGGIWVVGETTCLRVAERPRSAAGWEVLERVGVWQGLPTSGLHDLVEDPDGSLWLGTDMGLVRVPPAARASHPLPPPVALVEAAVDGRPVPTNEEIALPHGKNRLELRFAALSFREPALIRYRARLRPGDPWSAPTPQPSFRFVDLRPGRYRFEVEASLDGRRWSQSRIVVAARVLPPWWSTWWFAGSVLGMAAVALMLAHRVRVGQLLRLERQRTQIAMDLHDAIGSGLGSIRILSGLALRPTTPADVRTAISGRIAEVADELASALGDIVWSLRPGTGTLESLGTQLLARATPLVTARGMALVTALPEPSPEVELSLAVRRHVLLVGLEAVHNAARHSGGTRVEISLEGAGRAWCLRVEDDGRGLPSSPSGSSGRTGLGLESIRRRAEAIHARATWSERPGGGTRFTLEFDTRAEAAMSHERATGVPGRLPASSEEP